MDRRAFTLAALAIGGCAALAPPRVAPAVSTLAELEPLIRAEAGRSGLTITVLNNGCTTKADFIFHSERRDKSTNLAFARKRVDACKADLTRQTDLSFSWAELGVAPHARVFLLNPVFGPIGQER